MMNGTGTHSATISIIAAVLDMAFGFFSGSGSASVAESGSSSFSMTLGGVGSTLTCA